MKTPEPSVLHISTSDNLGGSARSAYKIHTGLRDLGLKSRMLVHTKVTDDSDVGHIHNGRLDLRLMDTIGRELVDRLDLQYLFYPSTRALVNHPWFQSADIIQLYNTHGGYFTHRALPKLSRHKRIYWRLSDMWPITGHCSYSHDCDRWQTGCGSCPLLSEPPSLRRDTTALLWRVKQRAYRRSNLTLVVTNTWMEQTLEKSPLMSRFAKYRIPNGVDAEVFKPVSTDDARKVLGISPSANVVLFIAQSARAGTRKGGEYVIPALEKAVTKGIRDVVLMVVGEGAESWPDHARLQTIRIGSTNSDRLLAIIYSAADILIHPALVENLPNSILEGMACGTPAVAFDSGGVSDAVRHMETGYLAKHHDEKDLSGGVQLLLNDRRLRLKMNVNTRISVMENFTQTLQAQKFAEMYTEQL